MVTSHDAMNYFDGLAKSGQITKSHAATALKRWAQTGGQRASTRIDRIEFIFTNESITCDCGKGIYCPTVRQRQTKPTTNEGRGT